jgi:hypothetical protein
MRFPGRDASESVWREVASWVRVGTHGKHLTLSSATRMSGGIKRTRARSANRFEGRTQLTRTIEIELNKFPQTPPTLLDPTTKAAVGGVTLVVKKLFHHYFLAKYGDSAEDGGTYEYERQITSGPDWRFKGGGIGADKESKRNASNELGKAFARWFLYQHLGFTYFTPLDDLLDRPNTDGSKWTRHSKGDLPDYVCGEGAKDVNVLEAKGRYGPVSFRTKDFQSFRDQVQRAQLLDSAGQPIQVKGFIAVAQWATETKPKGRSKLLVEDPTTEGRPPGQEGYPRPIGERMVAGHYGPIFELLQLPVPAAALREGTVLSARAATQRGVWECISGPLQGRRFVGGLLPDRLARMVGHPWWPFWDEPPARRLWRFNRGVSPFILARPMSLFGVEEHVFNSVLAAARGGADAVHHIEPTQVPDETGSLSLLRDGTVLGPADYFEPVGILDI